MATDSLPQEVLMAWRSCGGLNTVSTSPLARFGKARLVGGDVSAALVPAASARAGGARGEAPPKAVLRVVAHRWRWSHRGVRLEARRGVLELEGMPVAIIKFAAKAHKRGKKFSGLLRHDVVFDHHTEEQRAFGTPSGA